METRQQLDINVVQIVRMAIPMIASDDMAFVIVLNAKAITIFHTTKNTERSATDGTENTTKGIEQAF